MDGLPFSQSCENNKASILQVLAQAFADRRQVLEIASGTGQHADYFSAHLPHIRWQASERKVSEEQIKGELESLFSLGEIPADDDVAEAVVVFLSDRLRMVTGEVLRVDAGQLKRL